MERKEWRDYVASGRNCQRCLTGLEREGTRELSAPRGQEVVAWIRMVEATE